jgi:hypothetical protein
MKEKITQFGGLLTFAAVLGALLALELGLHVLSFYSHTPVAVSIILVGLATAIGGGAVPIAAAYSQMLDSHYTNRSADERLFKGLLTHGLVMLIAFLAVALLLMVVANFQLMAVFNIIKDVGLYLIWLYLWANAMLLFVWWLSRAKKRVPERVAFSVPLTLAGLTTVVMLMAFFLDISHLASFTGATQNILAIHVYVRMLLMIAGTLFFFGWTLMWVMRLYRREVPAQAAKE